MIAWRTWYARNEITHDKPLPPIDGSRRFICSYLQSLENIRKMKPEDVLLDPLQQGREEKGKNLELELQCFRLQPQSGLFFSPTLVLRLLAPPIRL
jgi:hypothetical protein